MGRGTYTINSWEILCISSKNLYKLEEYLVFTSPGIRISLWCAHPYRAFGEQGRVGHSSEEGGMRPRSVEPQRVEQEYWGDPGNQGYLERGATQSLVMPRAAGEGKSDFG